MNLVSFIGNNAINASAMDTSLSVHASVADSSLRSGLYNRDEESALRGVGLGPFSDFNFPGLNVLA